MKKLSILALPFLIVWSCKTHKHETVKQVPDLVKVVDTTATQSAENAPVFRLVVSMISIGEGTDQEAGAQLETFIAKFKEANGVLAINTNIPWGREGEMDNCFLLDNFSPAQQAAFVEGVKGLFYGNRLVRVDEYVANRFLK